MERQRQAYVYALLTVLFWSTVASAFKIALRHLEFHHLLLYAAAVSMTVLFFICLAQGKHPLILQSTRGEVFRSALLGLITPFLYYLILFKAYSLLPAQEAQPLNFTWPIMLVLLSMAVLRQRIGLRSIAAILVCFLGVFVISTRGDLLGFHFSNPLGAFLALSSSLLWATFWIVNVKDRRDEVVKLLLNFSFGFLYTFTLVFLIAPPGRPSWQGIAGAAYVGLFEMGITFILWLKALSLSRTTAEVSHLVYFSPFLSLIVIHFVVGEEIRAATWIGLSLIVGGVLIQELWGRRSMS